MLLPEGHTRKQDTLACLPTGITKPYRYNLGVELGPTRPIQPTLEAARLIGERYEMMHYRGKKGDGRHEDQDVFQNNRSELLLVISIKETIG